MNKQLAVLTVIVLIAVGGGVWLFQQSDTDELATQLLFADMHSKGSDIDKILIENSQGVVFQAAKVDDNWLAQVGYSEQAYPADYTKLASLVSTLSQGKLIEAKTNNKQKHDRLGLQSIQVEDSLARLVKISAGGKSWQVLIGNSVPIGDGRYVRLPKQSQTWRMDKNVELPVDQYTWLRHPILPFAVTDIQSVSRIYEGDWQLLLDDSSQTFNLAEMEQGQALQYQGILTGYVSSLVQLDYQEVFEPQPSFVESLQVIAKFEVRTQAQDYFTVILSQLEQNYYLHIESATNDQYWQQWYYQISSFSASQLNKKRADFLQQDEQSTVSQ